MSFTRRGDLGVSWGELGIFLCKKTKKTAGISVILQTEYHANSIRLRRVLLLRSDIRLAPSGIRFASFRANRIPLKPQGFNITVAVRQYHSLRQQRISLYTNRKRDNISANNRFVISFCLCRGSPKRSMSFGGSRIWVWA